MGDVRDLEYSLSASDQSALLKLARDSILTYFVDKKPDESACAHLLEMNGVFVSLHKSNSLRGCVGFPEAIGPLCSSVIEAARAAAFQDNRFFAVTEEELGELDIEISVLTQPQLLAASDPTEYLDKIRIGTDGLILRGKWASSLLLPQVASNNGFDAYTFLGCLCRKAGIREDSWKDPVNKIYTFQAIVFSEGGSLVNSE